MVHDLDLKHEAKDEDQNHVHSDIKSIFNNFLLMI